MSWIVALRNCVFGLVKNPRTRPGMEANLQGMKSELNAESTFLTRETLRSVFLPSSPVGTSSESHPDGPAILAPGHAPLTYGSLHRHLHPRRRLRLRESGSRPAMSGSSMKTAISFWSVVRARSSIAAARKSLRLRSTRLCSSIPRLRRR
jgi:hypothetical protein